MTTPSICFPAEIFAGNGFSRRLCFHVLSVKPTRQGQYLNTIFCLSFQVYIARVHLSTYHFAISDSRYDPRYFDNNRTERSKETSVRKNYYHRKLWWGINHVVLAVELTESFTLLMDEKNNKIGIHFVDFAKAIASDRPHLISIIWVCFISNRTRCY